ncbi:MAG TPA: hypothetical protein VEZ16_06195 [Microvirga sp.]|nr:hypothetical protein [Microvirga sp.]
MEPRGTIIVSIPSTTNKGGAAEAEAAEGHHADYFSYETGEDATAVRAEEATAQIHSLVAAAGDRPDARGDPRHHPRTDRMILSGIGREFELMSDAPSICCRKTASFSRPMRGFQRAGIGRLAPVEGT